MLKDKLKTRAIYFIIAAVAMTSLVACTKFEDTAPPRKITFEKAIYRPQTKAIDEEAPAGSILREFSEFKCKAFLHAEGYTGTQDMFTASGETIYAYDSHNARTATSDNVAYWAPSHDYYWPKGETSYINFVGWYDEKGTTPTTASETSLIWEDYTVLEDDNLLYAEEAWHYKATPDPALYHKDGQVSTGVPMLFHHALAKICINAKVEYTDANNVTGANEPENAGKKTYWVVTLRDISLSGVYDTGTLTLANSEPTLSTPISPSKVDWTWDGKSNGTLPWTPTGEKKTISMSDISDPLTEDANQSVLLRMRSVMPQVVTNDIVLSFKYNISTRFGATGAAGEEYAKEEITASIRLNDAQTVSGAIAKWDMNKKITYTITINPKTTTIKVDPAMVDWVAQTGGSTSL